MNILNINIKNISGYWLICCRLPMTSPPEEDRDIQKMRNLFEIMYLWCWCLHLHLHWVDVDLVQSWPSACHSSLLLIKLSHQPTLGSAGWSNVVLNLDKYFLQWVFFSINTNYVSYHGIFTRPFYFFSSFAP